MRDSDSRPKSSRKVKRDVRRSLSPVDQDERYNSIEGNSERPSRSSKHIPSSRRQSEVFGDDAAFFPSEPSRTASDLSQLKESIVVVFMGVTGSGKSTFISLLADQYVEVGHSLHSNTVDIGIYSFKDESDKTVILVDTPGFDDTSRSDAEILKDIAFFLASLYLQNLRFAGIIYLHRITDSRMQGSALKNLRIFQLLCGKANFKHVVLATTMWEDIESSEAGRRVGLQRQEELQHPEFFGGMIREGGDVIRHDGSAKSARQIVSSLTNQNEEVVLDIQRELIDEERSLDKTEVGQYLHKELLEAKKGFDTELAELQESMEDAMNEKDEELIREIRVGKQAAEARAAQHARDWEGLNFTMQQLAREKNPQYRNLAMNLQEQGRARLPSPEVLDTERRIRELEIALQESERQRERENISRSQKSRESHSSQLRRMREQTDELEREHERLRRRLAIERRRRQEAKRRDNPIMEIVTVISGMLGYQE